MKKDNIAALAKKVFLPHARPGRLLFKEGESRQAHRLGGVRHGRDARGRSHRRHDPRRHARSAQSPLPPAAAPHERARAEEIEYLSIDSDLLDVMLTWDQTGTYEVGELRGDRTAPGDDWMTTLLQTKAFHKHPAGEHPGDLHAHAARPTGRRESSSSRATKATTSTSSSRASCVVTRETPLNKDGIKLAELGVGDTFGEEALISEAKRNATCDADRRRADAPRQGGLPQAAERADAATGSTTSRPRRSSRGGGKWLDVRLPSEFENYHIDDSLNVPLYFIRLKLKTLDQHRPVRRVLRHGPAQLGRALTS
jgi:hypothetical protein